MKELDQISKAFSTSLNQCIDFGSHIDFDNIKLFQKENHDFFALAKLENEAFYIELSIGVLRVVSNLWNEVRLQTNDQESLIQGSLVWLFLHELSHYTLGHFEITGEQVIAETAKGREFGLLTRAPEQKLPYDALNDLDYIQIERCLELQADHEAIDMFLEAYSTDEWEELRLRVACISAVMVLIDVEDSKHAFVDSSHPKAATRIFQLLGHLSEMPLIQAQLSGDKNDIPSDDEQRAFSKEVVIPAFFVAIALAKAANAKHILDELGDLPAFFQDVLLAKTNNDAGIDQFKTVGAKEWSELKELNEKLLSLNLMIN